MDGELPDDGLAGPGGRGDEDALAALEGLAAGHLEVVEDEVESGGEGGELGPRGGLAAPGGGVALGGRGRGL